MRTSTHARLAVPFVLLAHAAAQTGTLDQVSPAPLSATSATFTTIHSLVWQQQVRAGIAGELEGVALTADGPVGGTLSVRIRRGAGWNTTPVVFAGTLVKTTSAAHERVFVDASSAHLVFAVDERFVIEIEGVDGSTPARGSYVPPASGPPLYSEPLFFLGPGCYQDCGRRIAFETWVLADAIPFCFGDASSATPCPCGNAGANGRGCENSASTGGARLVGSGSTAPDTIVLSATGELPNALSIFLQGDASLPTPVVFGDGVRCVGGTLKRLATKNASAGAVAYPGPGDVPISAQSAALGDPIAPGSTRWYQTYYRDPNLAFCPFPQGNGWNATNGLEIGW